MVYINPVEQFALIAKLVNILLFTISAFAILRQKRDYILNKMYFAAFLCWVVYIIADAFVFVLLPISPAVHFIGNRLRDIGVIAVLAMAFLIYKSYDIIKGGQDSINKTRLYIEIGIFAIIAVWLVIIDSVQVYDLSYNLIPPEDLPPPGTNYIVQPDVGIMTLILSAVPFALFIYTVIMLLLLTRKVDKRQLKKKMFLLTIGIAFIPAGMLYFILVGIPNIYAWWITAIGYTIWTISPILIWLSQLTSKKDED
ncbi:MAG: hypothetical protein JW776_14170 [Candidatus Lokiarchaeota archaeon]|nr:hypothetical protein [Candidatus Lokiarchaeota archaeon]